MSELVPFTFVPGSVWKQGVKNSHPEATEHTLKPRRNPFRSNLRAAIASLSILAWKCREIHIPFPHLMTRTFDHGLTVESFVCELTRVGMTDSTHIISCSIALNSCDAQDPGEIKDINGRGRSSKLELAASENAAVRDRNGGI